MKKANLWIDQDACCDVADGDVGFLIQRSPQGRADTYHLRRHPARTNGSHEPKLYGWCGETDNVSVYAEGLARVVKVAKNGRRRVAQVDPTAELLEELGYPELTPEPETP